MAIRQIDELKAIRKEFSSDEMQKIIPDTAQRLKIRYLSAERIRKIVAQAECFTKG